MPHSCETFREIFAVEVGNTRSKELVGEAIVRKDVMAPERKKCGRQPDVRWYLVGRQLATSLPIPLLDLSRTHYFCAEMEPRKNCPGP
jgi:hypothetical protein